MVMAVVIVVSDRSGGFEEQGEDIGDEQVWLKAVCELEGHLMESAKVDDVSLDARNGATRRGGVATLISFALHFEISCAVGIIWRAQSMPRLTRAKARMRQGQDFEAVNGRAEEARIHCKRRQSLRVE